MKSFIDEEVKKDKLCENKILKQIGLLENGNHQIVLSWGNDQNEFKIISAKGIFNKNLVVFEDLKQKGYKVEIFIKEIEEDCGEVKIKDNIISKIRVTYGDQEYYGRLVCVTQTDQKFLVIRKIGLDYIDQSTQVNYYISPEIIKFYDSTIPLLGKVTGYPDNPSDNNYKTKIIIVSLLALSIIGLCFKFWPKNKKSQQQELPVNQ